MERFLCIHCHFYQPPRENPWLETLELQESAYPYHDWNERITAECYATNAMSRILDYRGRIEQIVNNYSRISFNFGPTLLSWMEWAVPDVYGAIIEADRESRRRFGGHGSAMAQVYNHLIMPLATRRDKETQVRWGVRDFESRFGRRPEGMWLAETACDVETLEVLAENGVDFTVLAPSQAGRVRKLGRGGPWKDVSGGRIDPTRAYVCRLPSGKKINLLFYDGPISQAVAFEGLLANGEHFANRLLSGFDRERDWPQLMHIATDGETYGHHHKHGDMALAYALHHIEKNKLARVTNYGEYLELNPPTHEVEILEGTSWSCSHDIERWRSHCGCATRSDWRQEWRGPLRAALDWLRDEVNPQTEQAAAELLKDVWAARNDYIDVLLDRRSESVDRFFELHQVRELNEAERIKVLRALELQRHAQLMYTSCGWFFDEVSGIETVQVIQYAGRVIQLAQQVFGSDPEPEFVRRLSYAKSNLPEHGNGGQIYDKWVKPAVTDLQKVGAHYAITSLFDPEHQDAPIYCFEIKCEDYHRLEAGRSKMAVGRVRITSRITHDSDVLSFGVLHMGDHNVNAGIRRYQGENAYIELIERVKPAFMRADFPEVIRMLDRSFEGITYSLKSLFKDQQKRILDDILDSTLSEAEANYRSLYDHHAALMRFLGDNRLPMPPVLRMTAEFVINTALRRSFEEDHVDLVRIGGLLQVSEIEKIKLDKAGLAYTMQGAVERQMLRLKQTPEREHMVRETIALVEVASLFPFQVNLWQAQNIFYTLWKSRYQELCVRPNAQSWCELFTRLGDRLRIRIERAVQQDSSAHENAHENLRQAV